MRDLTIEDPPIDDVIELAFASGTRRAVTATDADARPIADERERFARARFAPMCGCTSTLGRVSIMEQFQYRAANYFYMIGMVIEPVIYLVVWSTIARQQGGSIDGYTPGTFAAYYIVWTLVRNMNIVFTPFGWEERIREGQPVGASSCGRSTRSTTTSASSPGGRWW